MQKKDLFSSSVSQNSADIDNPVPREGGLEKVSRQINPPLTLRCADLQRDASQGQVLVTLSMPLPDAAPSLEGKLPYEKEGERVPTE